MTPQETANDIYRQIYISLPDNMINSDKHIVAVKNSLMKCNNLLVIYSKDKDSENYKHYKEVFKIISNLHSFK